jgi:gamma-glutamyltranspeptidase/glutathione hydrolase
MIETPVFATAAVAAPHRLAVATGRDALAEGGNAIEAMVAMAATIAVVYPHMNGIGGDGFWLIRESGGRVHSIHAAGPSARLATRRHYSDRGYDSIPVRGPHAALTVPGAIGGWQVALRLAHSLGGKLPLPVLTGEAIRLARDGYPVSASEASIAPKEAAELRQAPGFAETFLVEGQPPVVGARRRAAALSATLSYLTEAGLDDFYRGDVAREIATDAARLGCLITREDLQSFEATVVPPLRLALDGRTLFNTAPPSQGLASLLLLAIFDRLQVSRAESFEHIHGLIEATKRAVAIRDLICTDPSRLPRDPGDFLQPRAIAAEAAQIDMARAAVLPLRPAEGGTIWMGAIDGAGLAVSYIQSLYWEYGSGCVLPATGILLHNRGISFSLDPAALNRLEPGLRPFHTLNAPLCVFADGRVLSYGSMGGDGQPQFQAQILTRMLLGAGLAEAIDRPRFVYGRTWGETSSSVKVESRFEASIATALARAGHEIERIEVPYHPMFGHAGMVLRHPAGMIEAAHDPRADGGASGL